MKPVIALKQASQLIKSLALVFVAAVILHFLFPDPVVKRVVFFPRLIGESTEGEFRSLPVKADFEEAVRDLVREAFGSPISLEFRRMFPREVRLNTVMVTGDTVVIDVDLPSIASAKFESAPSLAESLLKQTVTYNFRQISKVTVTYSGQPALAR